MRLALYQVDAFADAVFRGNPAGVCPLAEWPEDALLQDIAAENNLPETAFLVAAGDDFELRWFTPAVEVPLCGHATLASAFIVCTRLQPGRRTVAFHTRRSGTLTVRRDGEAFVMDFPALTAQPMAEIPAELAAALGGTPLLALTGEFWAALYGSEAEIAALQPDQAALARLPIDAVIATAPGDQADFVSRMFAPKLGIPEDPVTGAAHCFLAPWWAERLGRAELKARQISRRGGAVGCRVEGGRVGLSGRAILYLEGTIDVP